MLFLKALETGRLGQGPCVWGELADLRGIGQGPCEDQGWGSLLGPFAAGHVAGRHSPRAFERTGRLGPEGNRKGGKGTEKWRDRGMVGMAWSRHGHGKVASCNGAHRACRSSVKEAPRNVG